FTIVPPLPELDGLRLGLAGSHQVSNANLAVNLVHQFLLARQQDVAPPFLPSLYPAPLPAPYVSGLESARWPGRCQEVLDPKHKHITWFLDGAHTVESLTSCAEWYFHPAVGLKPLAPGAVRNRVLIFNCTSGRSGSKFLKTVLDNMQRQVEKYQPDIVDSQVSKGFFDHVIFCSNVTYADGQSKGDFVNNNANANELSALKVQRELADAWRSLVPTFPADNIHVLPSIQHAMEVVHSLPQSGSVDVLVAGSLHLVGGVIEVAEIGSIALAT
ncbi:Folylpolyglutamate synthetase, partial [Tulasnella sp. 403]